MALIAPGAFLWMTFQLQAANVDTAGVSTASDMWTGIVAALIVAFLTAFAYAELARKYPEAGTGSSITLPRRPFLTVKNPITNAGRASRNLLRAGLRTCSTGSIPV